jgi:hypothetical protein
MASYTPYGNNGWRVHVERKGVRKSRTFRTREAAERWVAELEAVSDQDLSGYIAAKERELAQTFLATKLPPRVLEANHVIPYKHDDILAAAIPTRLPSGVYFLIDGREVVYVGQSADILSRIATHRKQGRRFDRFTYIECEPEKMDELEAQYIAAFAPRLNVSFGRRADHAVSPLANAST